MNSIVLLTLSVLAVVLPAYAQYSLPFDACDTTVGRLSLDPFLVQALKSKYPKKYNAKLDYAKDLALDAKYRFHTAKMLARHMKNLNSANYDLQNLMCQAQQPGLLQPLVVPDQSAYLAQQQQLANLQLAAADPSRTLSLTPQTDTQVTCFSQMTDPRYQQPTIQLTGAQSTRCTKQESPCSCEDECDGGPVPNVLSSVVSTFIGILKSILK